jgi:hypothetical protein
VLGENLNPRERKKHRDWENCIVRTITVYTIHQIFFRLSYQGDETCNVWDRWEMHVKFESENLKGTGHLGEKA